MTNFSKLFNHDRPKPGILKKISILIFNLYLCRLIYGIVKYLKSYRIQFSGLATGKHSFAFDIDKKFFDCYPFSIVKDGALVANVTLDKQATMMIADFLISGKLRLSCDTCLREFDRNVSIEAQLLVKFVGDDVSEITDDIIVLNRNDFEFSIADFLYEHINLAVPHYVRCDEELDGRGCDEAMLAVLNELEPKVEEDSADDTIDPRWEMLEKLKNNN